MLTIIMECRNDEAELAQTLSALVSGAVEGVVRDVIVLSRESSDGSARVADAAGCRFLTEWDMKTVLREARGDWMLLLEPGARPLSGWVDAVVDHVAVSRGAARFSVPREHRPPVLKKLFGRLPPLERGYLLSRSEATARVKSGSGLEEMARGATARSLTAEIVPAWAMRALRTTP
jgi:hypothetical protein